MIDQQSAFFAYPARSDELVQTINTAIEKQNRLSSKAVLTPWQANDVTGIQITTPIFEKISSSLYVAADITFLNENVSFEIGYAIGKGKRCLLFRNSAIDGDRDLAAKVGIFDTLGYEEYSNSDELAQRLTAREDFKPLLFSLRINHNSPVYIIEPPKRSEAFGLLVSRVKKARWMYRSFSPSEDVRLSAMDAIRHVTQSAGVISPLLQDDAVGQHEHNIRAMFVAGLSVALDIPTLIIHQADYSPPMDVLDLTKKYSLPDDIRDIVQDFSLDITAYTQRDEPTVEAQQSILTTLRIGDPSAENEMSTLSDYYLATDDFQRTLRGEVNLVVGRKGSGKTALFVQLRNAKRANRQNIVVDLKPEGYQLVKLKERVLDFLTAGSQQHLITAFWEYLLLLEITYKVLEKDRQLHTRDHRLTGKYQRLKDIYGTADLVGEGDFSERLLALSRVLTDDYRSRFPGESEVNITTDQITEILYKHDIKALFYYLCDYLCFKREVWLLFDNIDKGWSVEGVSETDIFVLRCLINASRKLERDLRKKDIDFHSVVFIRDDVYALLTQGSADYGKEMRASLDWSDKDLLAELLKRRIAHSLGEDQTISLSMIWPRIAASHYRGDTSIEHMIERSLMRPRNLLKIFRYSLGFAINLGHEKIGVEDIKRGLETYSQDVVTEVDRELSDVFYKAKNLIYEFSEEESEFNHEEISTLIKLFGLADDDVNKVISFFLYYGVLGVQKGLEAPVYIFDVKYNIEILRVRIRKWGASTRYVVNPALWPALNVKSDRHVKLG
ncbi:MAG: P-loop ATPase, Sll1717 family [Rhodospirillales bacterium]